MLTIKALSYRYPNQDVLNNIDVELPGTGVIGLIGNNGAGKSTFLDILTGAKIPDSGEIYWKDIELYANEHFPPYRLGYLPENFIGPGQMRCGEYIQSISELHQSKAEDIDLLIDILDLQQNEHKKIKALSKGYQQRIGIFQAFAGNPELIILDEPTNGLDPGQKDMFFQLVSSHRSSKLILLSSHLLEEFVQLCDEFLILHNGQMTMQNRGSLKKERAGYELEGTGPREALASLTGVIESIEPMAQNHYRLTIQTSESISEVIAQLEDKGWQIDRFGRLSHHLKRKLEEKE